MVIGLTGPSGSGKTFLAEFLKKNYKCFIIDCDQISHKVIEDECALLFQEFGYQILLGPNVISRKKLAEIVFSDPEKLKKLESILFPRIGTRVHTLIEANKKSFDHIVIDAPTLGKDEKLKNLVDITIITKAPFLVRLFRIRKRDHISFDKIIKRFKNNKIVVSNYKSPFVINTVFNLRNQIENMFEEISNFL